MLAKRLLFLPLRLSQSFVKQRYVYLHRPQTFLLSMASLVISTAHPEQIPALDNQHAASAPQHRTHNQEKKAKAATYPSHPLEVSQHMLLCYFVIYSL